MFNQSTLTLEYSSYGNEIIICTIFVNEMLAEKVSIYYSIYSLQHQP